MNDFKTEPPQLIEDMLNAVRRVLVSGWYILGNEVVEFEKQWAEICGVSNAVGVGNGMDAIEISLRALDIGPGDEVITTSMTAFASVLAIVRAGAIPVLADINTDSGLLSVDSVSRCITRKTKAILLVHLYGQVCQMDIWTSLCKRKGINLIEDCAQAHLASWQGKVAGSFGEVGAYSFYPTKNLGTPGDAGMLVTSNKSIAQRSSQLRNYGQSLRYHHPDLGMNSRLDEIHAAILIERLKWLQKFTLRRRQIADAYRKRINNPLIQHLAPPEEISSHVYHLYVVKSNERDALQLHLQRNQVQALIHYPIPVHQQKPFINVARDPNGLRSSELHSITCLSLPCNPQMTDNDIDAVIFAANSFMCP